MDEEGQSSRGGAQFVCSNCSSTLVLVSTIIVYCTHSCYELLVVFIVLLVGTNHSVMLLILFRSRMHKAK